MHLSQLHLILLGCLFLTFFRCTMFVNNPPYLTVEGEPQAKNSTREKRYSHGEDDDVSIDFVDFLSILLDFDCC